ncbi:MAG: hypothetical protein LCH26_00540 [Proteobacteria bacterium]|nr:hypothetical protein [Pseudomonadota bacterium]
MVQKGIYLAGIVMVTCMTGHVFSLSAVSTPPSFTIAQVEPGDRQCPKLSPGGSLITYILKGNANKDPTQETAILLNGQRWRLIVHEKAGAPAPKEPEVTYFGARRYAATEARTCEYHFAGQKAFEISLIEGVRP